MIIQFDKATIEANIVKVAASERVTKSVLAVLSRELLAYVYETNDVAMVSRLIHVLTPINKKVACLYFPAFLGWSFNEKELTFGKKLKDKAYTKKYDDACDFLQVDDNNIWVWADKEVVLQTKPKDYASKITQLVTKALKDEQEGLDAKEILFAILASDQITLGELMSPADAIKEVDGKVA